MLVAVACVSKEPIPPEESEMKLSLSSPAFQDEGRVLDLYTCEGQDISPPLVWSNPPEGSQSLVLIMDDPDAPGGAFTHWVLFNLPMDSSGLSEAIPTLKQLEGGGRQGKNDFGRIGYGGPCPPSGRSHNYRFNLYALDKLLDLPAGASKKQVLDAMTGHILARGQLTGTYQR